jgi:LmbE family N-acetylglucosaminyl deacetylase
MPGLPWSGLALLAASLLVAILGAAALLLRQRAYRRRLSYDPRQSWSLGAAGSAIETVPVDCKEQAFVLPKLHGIVSGFLEIDVDTSLMGLVADPTVAIRADQFNDVQYVERGAHGSRFFNISRLLGCVPAGTRVRLTGRGLVWRRESVKLHLCCEGISSTDRVLVIAPHPDDAEIAAFGLYSDTDATVVTLTAGDASDRYRNAPQPWMHLSRDDVARIRVLDSLTVPQLGHVSPERAINLCFPDGQLRDLCLHPETDFRNEPDAVDFSALRRMNRSSILQAEGAGCNWNSLVHDLTRIVAFAKPTIVVAPHPKLDPHPDHLYATIAVSEALEAAGATAARMFLYVVHNRRSELWPFGPAASGVPLPPILAADGNCGSGFYSHALSTERQRLKLVALEAMHDLREIQWPVSPDAAYRQVGARIVPELRAWVHGMGRDPTSYLRRAVRPDEVFFVTSCQDALSMARQATDRQASQRAAAA